MPDNRPRKTAVVFSHCHWDIEWYLPFRSFRFWLLDIMDGIQTLVPRHPAFHTYMLDGQVAPLDHYLAIRPECREAVTALVRGKALAVGPFYTQFDEWLNGPEAIVRNCLHGDRRAREYGGVMKAGYLPDNFGHPLQMPQILAGFGLHSLLFMRGMPDRPEGCGDQFLWQGLDGSRILAIHLSASYGNAVAAGARFDFSSVYRTTPFQDEYRSAEPYWDSANHTDIAAGAQALIKAAEGMDALCPTGIIPLANGVDHTPPQQFIGEMIEQANQTQQTYRFIHADAEVLTRLIRESGEALPVLCDELYGSRHHLILTGTLAARAYLKQDNFIAEALLTEYAEPLATIAMLSGDAYPERLLEEAWELLFVNQAHDGIHGSSADPVHVEMRQRYAAVRQVATGICHRALAVIGRNQASSVPGAAPLLVFAPETPRCGASLVDAWIATGGREFHLADSHGCAIPCQVISNPHQHASPAAQACATITWPGGPTDTRVVFEAPLAPYVVSTFHVVPAPSPVPLAAGLRTSPDTIENDAIRVTASSRGVEICDKATGRTYANALEFEDEADAGDIWDFSPTWKPEPPVSSRGAPVRVALIESGPVRAALRLETTLRLPRELRGESRSQELVETVLVTTIAITASSPVIVITTELDNQSRDHRLRIRIPTGLDATAVKSQSLFGAIQRQLRHSSEGGAENWAQMPPKTFPFREWVAVADASAGLAFAGRGMYEYESRREDSAVALYVTLLRCVGVMGRYNLPYRQAGTSPGTPTPDAQCPGPCRFAYALIPFRPDSAGTSPFVSEALAFLYPPIVHPLLAPGQVHDVRDPLFALDPSRLRVCAVKKAQDGEGIILRFWENDGLPAAARLRLSPAIGNVFLCNLNEEKERELPKQDHAVAFAVAPYKIVTLLLLPS